MKTIQVNKRTTKHISAKFAIQRFFFLMVAIMASMTFTACDSFNDDDDENGGGDGPGSISGKRIKTVVEAPVDGPVRTEHTYNSNGTLNRVDSYDASGKRVMYSTFTSNSDGTRAKHIQVDEAYTFATTEYIYFYNTDKTPQKMEGTISTGSTSTHVYTFQNGRKTREVISVRMGGTLVQEIELVYNYDNNGRRTTTTQTPKIGVPVTYTRTYNSDGTLRTVTYTVSGQTITKTFTWENGNSTVNEDHFLGY